MECNSVINSLISFLSVRSCFKKKANNKRIFLPQIEEVQATEKLESVILPG